MSDVRSIVDAGVDRLKGAGAAEPRAALILQHLLQPLLLNKGVAAEPGGSLGRTLLRHPPQPLCLVQPKLQGLALLAGLCQ